MTAINATRLSWPKRIALATAALFAFTLFFIVAIRVTVSEMSRGIESSPRIPAYAFSPSWDLRNTWSDNNLPASRSVDSARLAPPWESAIARNAAVLAHSSSFDHSVRQLHQIVSAHQGFLEDLRTQSQSGSGRALAATLALPFREFDATVADLKSLGRVEAISESGEDSAVKLATSERHLAAAQTNLARLQRLQRERKGELRDAVALEKDIAQANETLAETERQHENLASTVAQAHIRLTLLEDYRAPLQANLAANSLALRNSVVEGLTAIFSSISLILSVVFEYGLPLLFWAALLFFPGRFIWRRFRRLTTPVPAAS